MVIKLDSWLIEKADKGTQKIQRLTGWTCFDLARSLFLPFMASIIATASFGGGMFLWSFFIGPVLWIGLRGIVSDWEETALSDIQKGARSSVRLDVGALGVRLVSLSVSVFGAVVWLPLSDRVGICATLTFVCVCLISYLSACTPLPPCRGILRDKLSTVFLIPARTKGD